MSDSRAITDSPWFWGALFATMAIVALLAIGGKYERRQSNIEQKYQARERMQVEREVSDLPHQRPFSTPGATLVPLWPLMIVLGAVMILCLVMLYRSQQGLTQNSGPQRGHSADGAP